MAEYISRAKVDYEFMTTRGGGDVITNLYERILDIPTADVVERAEYEKLRLVNLDLAETNKGLLAEHEQLEKLRSKIDNAIEEINKHIGDTNCNSKHAHGMQFALEIPKRNIEGE